MSHKTVTKFPLKIYLLWNAITQNLSGFMFTVINTITVIVLIRAPGRPLVEGRAGTFGKNFPWADRLFSGEFEHSSLLGKPIVIRPWRPYVFRARPLPPHTPVTGHSVSFAFRLWPSYFKPQNIPSFCDRSEGGPREREKTVYG